MKPAAARAALLCLLGLALVLAAASNSQASFLQTMQDQISVYILVNVTPAPIVYNPALRTDARRIETRVALRARGSSEFFDALAPDRPLVVAQAQQPVKVEAEVSPNPKATMLYSNVPADTITGTAGTSVTQTCAYTVTVDTAKSSWTLYDGLSNDFSSVFPGNSLANNTYLQGGTPNAQATPFYVYPDNNDNWAVVEKSSYQHTYCVDLVLTIPGNVPGGAYSTNAVYSLYY